MARVPKDVVAMTPGGKITIEQVLGWLVMFSVPDQPVSLSKVLREFAAHDLDTNLLPTDRVPVNVFQQACASVRTGKRNGEGKEIEADQIYEDAHRCVYQITLKVRDRVPMEEGGKEIIEFEKSMRVRFSKTSSVIDVEPLDKDAYRELSGLESLIRDYFDKHAKMVPGGHIRRAVRGTMKLLGGTNVMKRSGAYFVPKGVGKDANYPRETLDTLSGILESLYGEDATLWLVPLANSKTEREMVERHFELNIEETTTEVITKLSGILKRDPKYIRKDVVRNAIQEARHLGALHQRYKDLLGESLKGVEYKLGLMGDQIEALVAKADELGTEMD